MLVSIAAASVRADESAPANTVREDEILHGTVVKVEDKEIYVDLGSNRGVADGAPLRLKRAIKLKHPVTRAPISDWIPIGAATITQAGGSLSRAVVGELVDSIKPGDVAEILIVGAREAHAPAASVAAAPAVDAETQELLRVFAAQTGATLDARIAAWERFLSQRPGSRFATAIKSDLETLHSLRDEMRAPTATQISESVTTVTHHAPSDAAIGARIPLVFVLAQPDRVASAYLHYRTAGSPTYRRLLLVREHDIYLRGIIPPDVVRPPGVEYFVELSTPNGRSAIALGAPEAPTAVEVASPPLIDRFAPTPDQSSVRIDGRYLDFATFDKRGGDHRDQMTMATIDFVYRMRSAVESLGVGYGIYDGKGGSANQVWTTDNPEPTSGFRYGYGDIELGGHVEKVHVAVGGQLIAGVGQNGFGMGVEGRLRLGDRDGTSLVFSGRTVDQVGFLS
ncbi:MAG TPA: hypothetical protein VGO00_05150, partial [Kofleriaceae bacterium]|nr:hypothetical protein [Kofleriaceae bacterium]